MVAHKKIANLTGPRGPRGFLQEEEQADLDAALAAAPQVAADTALVGQYKQELETAFMNGTDGVNDAAVKTYVEQGSTRGAVESIVTQASRTQASPTAVVFGTSLEAQNGTMVGEFTGGGFSSLLSSRGWANWFQQYTGYRFDVLYNAGIGGNRYDQMRARLEDDVLAYDPDWVLMGWPANDATNGRTAAETIADAEYMIREMSSAGTRVLLLISGAGHDGLDTSVEREHFDTWRTWALSQNGRRGVVTVDTWGTVMNTETYGPLPGMTVDAVHYSLQGAQKIGRAAAQALTAAMPALPLRNLLNNGRSAIIGNPGFRDNGAGWSAAVASGATLTRTYPGGGRAYFDASGYTTQATQGIEWEENISAGRFAVGDIVQVTAIVNWANLTPLPPSTPSGPRPMLRCRTRRTDGSFHLESFNMSQGSSAADTPSGTTDFPRSGELMMQTAPIRVGSNVERLYVLAGFFGAAEMFFEVSDLQVYKLEG